MREKRNKRERCTDIERRRKERRERRRQREEMIPRRRHRRKRRSDQRNREVMLAITTLFILFSTAQVPSRSHHDCFRPLDGCNTCQDVFHLLGV